MRSIMPSRYGTAAKKSGFSSNAPVQQFGALSVPLMRPSPSPCEHAGATAPATSTVITKPRARRPIGLTLADPTTAKNAFTVVEDGDLTATQRAHRRREPNVVDPGAGIRRRRRRALDAA